MNNKQLKIENVEIRQADSLTLMKDLPAASLDLILCDPPYGTTKHVWDMPVDLKGLLAQFDRLLVPGGRVIFFSAHPFTATVAPELAAAGWLYYELIWEKAIGSGQQKCGWMPLKIHENIFVCYRVGEAKKGYYQPQLTTGTPYKKARKKMQEKGYGAQIEHTAVNLGTRQPTTILSFSNARITGEHPTAKPIELFAYLIRQYSASDSRIFDPFMGGGNSAVAAVNEGRKYLGIEINETYFELACVKIKPKQLLFKSQRA